MSVAPAICAAAYPVRARRPGAGERRLNPGAPGRAGAGAAAFGIAARLDPAPQGLACAPVGGGRA